MTFGAGELGPLAFRGFEADEAAGAGIAAGIDLLDRAEPPSRAAFSNAVRADGDDLLRVLRLTVAIALPA